MFPASICGRVLARAFMWLLPLLVGGVALFVWMISGRYVETDNAYVKGDRVYIMDESGGVAAVTVGSDTYLFWDADGTGGAPDSAIKVDHVNAVSFSVADFI